MTTREDEIKRLEILLKQAKEERDNVISAKPLYENCIHYIDPVPDLEHQLYILKNSQTHNELNSFSYGKI